MSTIKITKQFSFEMAHALLHYDGLCQNIHGHSYKMDVTVTGAPSKNADSPKVGMVMDFGDLKRVVNETIVDEMDHALVLNEGSDQTLIDSLKNNYKKVVTVPFQPTTENLLQLFAERLQAKLPKTVELYAIKLRETDSSYAEWCKD